MLLSLQSLGREAKKSNEKNAKKIEEKLKCVCAPARMEKQIINFGISFQLKVTNNQHKKEGTKTRSSCRKLRVSFSRYAKRCFYNRRLLFRFSKVFFLAQNRVTRSTAKVNSVLHIKRLHMITKTSKLRNFVLRHFMPNLIYVFYCFPSRNK